MPINQDLKFCCQTSYQIFQSAPKFRAKHRQLLQLAPKFHANYFNWRQNFAQIISIGGKITRQFGFHDVSTSC
jgi:hypothetical protein